MFRALMCVFGVATLSGATDLAGTWRAQATTRGGEKYEIYYVFKTDGAKFTGVIGTPTDRREIFDGSIESNRVAFDTRSPFRENSRVTSFQGELGDDLKITPKGRSEPVTLLHKVSGDTEYHPATPHAPFPPFRPIPSNGLAKTPPMGWNSWNRFAGKIDDPTVRSVADAMVSSGMRDAGYIYVNIDDTWEAGRDKDGNIQSNAKFPDMKSLADYVHSKGLKLGIYSSPGPKTCAGYEASYGHESQDARTWAAWGVDYLKYDWCSATADYSPDEMAPAYQKMALALRATGRSIIFSLCQYGWQNVGEWGAAAGGNSWRTTGDISDRWESMSRIGFGQNGREKFAGPGHWNDPDMLEIGNGGMTPAEYRTHMSLWSMLAAPLLAGNDVRAMSPENTAILTNKEVIAIDQDKLGRQGFRVKQDGDLEVWKKPLSKGVAIGLFNRGGVAAKMTIQWKDIGIEKKNPKVRDLWEHRDIKAPGQFSANVPSHGVVLLRVQ